MEKSRRERTIEIDSQKKIKSKSSSNVLKRIAQTRTKGAPALRLKINVMFFILISRIYAKNLL